MAKLEIDREAGMNRNREAAIDRLDHCAHKVAALADMNFLDLSSRGVEGFRFQLRDLGNELGEIFDELNGELKQGIRRTPLRFESTDFTPSAADQLRERILCRGLMWPPGRTWKQPL